jgi:hypothetical protein
MQEPAVKRCGGGDTFCDLEVWVYIRLTATTVISTGGEGRWVGNSTRISLYRYKALLVQGWVAGEAAAKRS